MSFLRHTLKLALKESIHMSLNGFWFVHASKCQLSLHAGSYIHNIMHTLLLGQQAQGQRESGHGKLNYDCCHTQALPLKQSLNYAYMYTGGGH